MEPVPRSHGLANHEVVTIAVYALGGHLHRVETEDVAMKANEISPGRFAWRKYPEQVNLDAVRKRLWDARRVDKGAYVIGCEKDGWALTDAGHQFAERHARSLSIPAERQPLGLREQQWRRSERGRLIGTAAYEVYETSGPEAVSYRDACSFFRVDDSTSDSMVRQRVERTLTFFREDPLLGDLVVALASRLTSREAPHE